MERKFLVKETAYDLCCKFAICRLQLVSYKTCRPPVGENLPKKMHRVVCAHTLWMLKAKLFELQDDWLE